MMIVALGASLAAGLGASHSVASPEDGRCCAHSWGNRDYCCNDEIRRKIQLALLHFSERTDKHYDSVQIGPDGVSVPVKIVQ